MRWCRGAGARAGVAKGEARTVREQYQVSPYDAAVLANDLELARYFERLPKAQKSRRT
jgi:Asp-tRNAAsn/Glu-tRNAGln amidotransferase B subunit (PET112 homolog)